MYKFPNDKIPPGYVFFSNSGTFNYQTKENNTVELLKKKCSKSYNIPEEDILILENCVEHSKFSVFLPEKYSEWVRNFTEGLQLILDSLKTDYRDIK